MGRRRGFWVVWNEIPLKIRFVWIAFLSNVTVRNRSAFSPFAELQSKTDISIPQKAAILWLLWLRGFRRHEPTPRWPPPPLWDWHLFEEAGWRRLLSSYRLYLLPYSSTPTQPKWGSGCCLSPLWQLEVWLRWRGASTDPRCHQWPPGFRAATRYLWKTGNRIL